MYLVLKTSKEEVEKKGSLFEAIRGHWRLDPSNAKKCEGVVVSLLGKKEIEEVYKVDEWYASTLAEGRYVFAGSVDENLSKALVGKKLNKRLTAKGLENPVLYVEEKELLEGA